MILLLGGKDGNLNYYENVGDSTSASFTTSVTLSANGRAIDIGTYSTPSFVDIDGDGDYDLVIGEYLGELKYYENKGNSTSFSFTTSANLSANGVYISLGDHSAPSFVDIDGDNDYDLVAGYMFGMIKYYENVGDLTSASFTTFLTLSANDSRINVGDHSAPSFVDIDGDNDYDMVVGNANGTLNYYENKTPPASKQYLFNVAENNASVSTLSSYDADGDTLTYGIDNSYKDGAKFTIDSSSGALSFKSAPDFETPLDDGTNNVYDVNLTISDSSNTSWTVAQITVTNVNDAPIWSNIDKNSTNEDIPLDINLTKYISDDDNDTINFSVTSSDTSKATLNLKEGVLSITPIKDANGKIDLNITANDGTIDSSTLVNFSINAVPDIPTFINDGYSVEKFGDSNATITTYLTSVTLNANGAIINIGSYSKPSLVDIDGDNDYDLVVGESFGSLKYYENVGNSTSASFTTSVNLNANGGAINVGNASAPSFVDIDGDNDYDLVVGESDGNLNYYENVGDSTSFSFTTSVTLSANGETINVGENSAPSFVDIDGDNDYDLVVGEYDGNLNYYENVGDSTSASFTTSVNLSENGSIIDIGRYSAPSFLDIDGDKDYDMVVGEHSGILSYYENVGDSTSFSFTTSGALSANGSKINLGVLYSSPSFVDIDGDKDYDMVVGKADGTLDFFEAVLNPVSKQYLFSVVENNTSVSTLSSYDADGDTLIYGIDNSYKDGAKFTIDSSSGALSFKSAPDYEIARDNGTNNVYDVNITISDSLNLTWTVAQIRVTNISDSSPAIISNGNTDIADIDVVENTTAVTTVEGVDRDAEDTLIYSISGGTDSSKFDINSSNGVLIFKSAPNYESPTDSGSDNVYVVDVTVTDSTSLSDNQTLNVRVTNNTNEAPSVSLSRDNTNLVENGGTSTITATLSEAVNEATTVTIGRKSSSSASSNDFNLSSTTITIDGNTTTGTATFTSLHDLIDDNNEIATIEILNVSGGENAIKGGTSEVNITITDDDTAGFTISKSTASVDENGSTDTFTIKLDSEPTGDVVIDLNSSDTSEATINPETLTFNASDWNNSKTITITGVDDSIVDGNINSTITAKINQTTTLDSVYDAIANKTLAVTTRDDDSAGFSLNKTTANVSENNTTDTFTVVLDRAPTSDVVFNITSSDEGEATVNPSSLTFTSSNWDTNQSVTITGVDDSLIDSTQTSIITISVNDGSSNDSFDPLSDQNITVTTEDNDNKLPVITQGSSVDVNMSEDGNPKAFTLILNATDGDNETLTWSIDSNASKGIASVSSSPTGNSQVISYTPTANYNGSDNFVVKVSDPKNGTDTIRVDVRVDSVNDVPLINTIFNDINMSEDNGTTNYDIDISDADFTDLNLSIESNNTNIIRVTPNFINPIKAHRYKDSLDFNLTTLTNANGLVKITINLSDGEANATKSFDVNVSAVNDLPMINTLFSDINMSEDNGTTNYDIDISDADFTDLNLSIESNNTNIIRVTPNFINPIKAHRYKDSLDFNLTTLDNANGLVKITINLSDGVETNTTTFDVNVSAINDAPVLANVNDVNKSEDSASSFINLNTTDIDSNASTVTYSVSSSDTSIVTVQEVNGVLIITPKEDANGVVTIEVNATVDGQTVTDSFTYTLNSVNDAPSIAHIDDIFLDENGSVLSDSINFTIYDDVNISSWELKSSNQALLRDDNLSFTKVSDENASLSYTIGVNKTGKTKVKVTVKDDENLSYSELFYITVARSNDELCVENTKTALTFDIIRNANVSQKYITNDLRLVDTMSNICNAKITWSSSSPTLIGDDGILGATPDADKTVALSATITKRAKSTTKQFLLTVVPSANNISDAEAVSKITFQDIKNTNHRQNEIVADLTLVSSSLGKDINWSSTDVNSTIIDLYTFKVTRPDSNAGDTNVTLTASINGTVSKDFNLTVLAMPNNTSDKLSKDKSWINFERILDKNKDNNNVIYDLIKPLPSSAPNGSTITWTTSNSDVITTDGDVTRSSTGDRYITMTASFENGGITDTKEFLLRVLENKTTTSSDTNVSFQQVVDNNDSVSVSFKEDGVESNTTASFDSSLVSSIEKIISDDSIKSVVELADKIINLFLNTDGTAQSQAEFTNDNNESVISSVKIDATKSSTSVDANGTVVSTVALDATTTLKAELNSDGSVSHTVEANGGSTTKITKASSSIPGSQVQADNAGNVETTSEVKNGGVIYKAVATSDKNGQTTTKFVTINLSTGEETTVDKTLSDSTPYAAGNSVEISEIDGTVYIKTTAPLDGNLSVQ